MLIQLQLQLQLLQVQHPPSGPANVVLYSLLQRCCAATLLLLVKLAVLLSLAAPLYGQVTLLLPPSLCHSVYVAASFSPTLSAASPPPSSAFQQSLLPSPAMPVVASIQATFLQPPLMSLQSRQPPSLHVPISQHSRNRC